MDNIFMKFFVHHSGNRMPQEMFFEICKKGNFNADNVVSIAYDKGYKFSDWMHSLQDHIDFNFPFHK